VIVLTLTTVTKSKTTLFLFHFVSLNNLNNKERIEVILKLLPFATPKLTSQEKQGVEEQPELPLFLED
tara:strand:+ start:86 stop:289 length:204 start_codon:yes stop_codon:yes gene_type:complete